MDLPPPLDIYFREIMDELTVAEMATLAGLSQGTFAR